MGFLGFIVLYLIQKKTNIITIVIVAFQIQRE